MSFSNTIYTTENPDDKDQASDGADEIRQMRADILQRMTVLTMSDDTGWGNTATAAKDKGFFTKAV